MLVGPALLLGTPLEFIPGIQGKIDMLERPSSGHNMPASVHGVAPSPGADCRLCIKDPKGVPSQGHKPSDEMCPDLCRDYLESCSLRRREIAVRDHQWSSAGCFNVSSLLVPMFSTSF